MWNILLAFFFGSAVSSSRTGRRLLRPFLILLGLGVIAAGLVYTYVVYRAVTERSQTLHVHAHSTR